MLSIVPSMKHSIMDWFYQSISRTATSMMLAALFISSDVTTAQPPEDTATEPALDPATAEKSFRTQDGLRWEMLLSEPTITQPLMTTFDSHGRLWVAEYRQYPNPEGLKQLSRDKHWRIVYDTVPQPPGRGGLPGKDRISVHEDTDGDGTFETHRVFVDHLNIATAVAPVTKGAWVLNPPYLLYYADENEDLQADGPPEIHLTGFGLEDTHSVVNSLCMGPDGWLYAAQGSTVSGMVKAYGSDEKPFQSLGQAIWRYHPVTRRYEIFAEGGGNAFGVAFDDRGDVYSGHNGGDTRGFHYYQGGYYRKGFSKHGSLSNPHSYGYLNPMQHDPIPRFTHAMLMTESTALAPFTPQSMLAVDPLHGKLIQTELKPTGSTFATRDIGDTVSSRDKWFRPVAITDGPDGAAYICDWYDSVVAHIYAFEGRVDRDRGRVYRLRPEQTPDPTKAALWNSQLANAGTSESLEYLLATLSHPYRWQRWQARRLIAEHPRRDELVAPAPVMHALTESDDTHPVEYLWTAHACGWIRDTIPFQLRSETGNTVEYPPVDPAKLLLHPNAAVREWTVRLVCDDNSITPETLAAIEALAREESDPRVLSQIACSAKRLPSDHAVRIVAGLLSKPRSADDPFFPLLCWWAIEQHHGDYPSILKFLIDNPETWAHPIARTTVYPNLIRRWSTVATPEAYLAVSKVFQQIGTLPAPLRSEAANAAQSAFEQSFVGRSLSGVPDAVIDAMVALGQPPLTLQVRRGDEAAIAQAVTTILDPKATESVRMQLARLAGELPHTRVRSDLRDALLAVTRDASAKNALRSSAISALASFDSDSIATTLLDLWKDLPQELKPAAGSVLAARSKWTEQWLNACESDQVNGAEMPPESVRAMKLHLDASLQQRLTKLYPEFASIDLATANERSQQLAKSVVDGNGDPYKGKKLYRELCGRCHQLFDDGGRVGPDLTGYQRDQLGTLLRNIVAPSLEIREGYQMVRLMTSDAVVLSGFIESEQPDQVVLRSIDGQMHTLDRGDIEQLQPQVLSLMPEGLLDKLDETQLRDLMAYLRSSQPLNDGT